jgi:hypothetical protein
MWPFILMPGAAHQSWLSFYQFYQSQIRTNFFDTLLGENNGQYIHIPSPKKEFFDLMTRKASKEHCARFGHNFEQGCQMVCFQTKNPNLGKFWRILL